MQPLFVALVTGSDGRWHPGIGDPTVMGWVTTDKCPSTPTTSMEAGANCQDWNPCNTGSEVKFCTVPGGGHSFTRAASPLIWDFFSKFSLP